MSVTDAVESKSLPKQNDASHTLVTEAYDPKTLKGTPALGPSPDTGTRSQAVSNGQLDFGNVGSLYGNQGSHTGGTPSEGKLGPTPAGAKGTTAETEAKESEVAAKKALGAVNPNPQVQIDKVQHQPQPADPRDIGLPTASAAGVDQTIIGDCYFESALASLANSSKGEAALQNMIKTNSDGSYTVTFPGDTSNPVNITQAELANASDPKSATDPNASGEVDDTAKWARIAQTAFLKYDNIGSYGTGPDAQDHKVTDSDSALHLLTGQTASTDSMAFSNQDTETTLGSVSNADVARSLTQSLQNGDPVTASTGPSSNNRGGLEGDHVFSVLSYDPKTDKVVVRNPWGHNDNTPLAKTGVTVDGITSLGGGNLEMSLNTFTHSFSDVNFANQNPVNTDVQNVETDMAVTMASGAKGVSDLVHGNLAGVGSDLANYDNGSLQVASDGLYAATSSFDQAVNMVGAMAHAGVEMADTAYQDVTSFI